MKKLFFTFVMVLLGVGFAMAQSAIEGTYHVRLKSGLSLHGQLLEYVPLEKVVIKASGKVYEYTMDKVEFVKKEESTPMNFSGEFQPESYIKKGYRGFIEGSYSVGVGHVMNRSRWEIATSQGYQFAPWLYAGVGVAYDAYTAKSGYGESGVHTVPVFGDVRVDFLNYWACPFADIRAGYALANEHAGFYMNASVGCRFALSKTSPLALNVGVGYSMQMGDKAWWQWAAFTQKSEYKSMSAVSVKVGFEW